MQPSASVAHTTDFHREPKWEPPRRAFGILGICITAAGVAIFVYFFSTHHFDASVTAHGMGFAALAVTLSLGGMQASRWGFSSQRAYDTKRAFIEDLAAMFAKQNEIADHLAELSEQVAVLAEWAGNVTEEERVQAQHSAKARQDVADMRQQLSDLSLDQGGRLEGVEKALERITYKLAVLAGDNVVDLDTARAALSLNGRLPHQD